MSVDFDSARARLTKFFGLAPDAPDAEVLAKGAVLRAQLGRRLGLSPDAGNAEIFAELDRRMLPEPGDDPILALAAKAGWGSRAELATDSTGDADVEWAMRAVRGLGGQA